MPEVDVELFNKILEGDNGRQLRPVDGETAAVRATLSVNPNKLVALTVEVAEAPATTVMSVGLAVRVKSCTVTLMIVLWSSVPLIPVTVMV